MGKKKKTGSKASAKKSVKKTAPAAKAEPEVKLPIEYYEASFFAAIFPAPKEELQKFIPHEDLKLVEVLPGWGAVAFGCYNYISTSIGPYYEFAVAIPVRHKPLVEVPFLPLLIETKLKDFGMWVHRLPVSTQVALDAGVKIWGYPKFIADMSIEQEGDEMVGTLSEGGENIFTLRVKTTGIPQKSVQSEMSTYTMKDGNILRTTINHVSEGGIAIGIGKAGIKFGEHKFGRELAAAGVRPEFPIQVRHYPLWTSILPEAQLIIRG